MSEQPTLFPEAASLFTVCNSPTTESLQRCDVVLDTNVLLLPYRAGKDSLDKIAQVLQSLAEQGRLVVPGQVAREYARNRPRELGDMIKSLADHKSRIKAPATLNFPLLENLKEFGELREADKTLKEAVQKYVSSADSLLEAVHGWGATDPVQRRYAAIFGTDQVVDPDFALEQVQQEFEHRCQNHIPPGYKDASKSKDAFGDYLIWLTILQVGRDRKRDLVFVTGEEKADWVHRANNRPLMPRVELMDEFRRNSEGGAFHILHLSRLLQILEPSMAAETLEQVQAEERRVRERTPESFPCPFCSSTVTWRVLVGVGETAKPRCKTCGNSFHAHRTADGIIVRKPNVRRATAEAEMRKWFFENFDDPANGVPYDGREGGYQYINGGPHDPREVLAAELSGRYSDEWIDDVANDISMSDGEQWVRTGDY